MPNFDPALLERIKSLVPISRLVGEYVEADARKSTPGDLWACCPFHAEKSPSFHAEDAKGIYHCFGCGASGDHFQWMQEHQGMTFIQAVQHLADMAGVSLPGERDTTPRKPAAKYAAPVIADPYEGYEFIPVPDGTPAIVPGKKTPPIRRPKEVGTEKEFTTYTPSAVHLYNSPSGDLLGYVVRQDMAGGKKVTPGLWWVKAPDGYEGWSHGSLPSPRPLYGLTELLARPDAQVLIVEGEKCRDAAHAAIGARLVVVSWLGGTSAVRQTDWTPLAGRSLIFWPDNDDAGAKAMAQVRGLAKGLRNKDVAPYGGKGGDVADLIADGGSVADYIKANIRERASAPEGVDDDDPRDGSVSNADSIVDSGGASNGNGREVEGPDFGLQGGDNVLGEAKQDAPPPRRITNHDPDWESLLQYTKNGDGLDKTSLVNPALMLQYHDMFKGIFAWNAFANEAFLMREPPWERKWTQPRLIKNTDITSTAAQMEFVGLKPKRNDMNAVISQVAEYNSYNPVVDALERLEWDGLPRLQGGKVGSRTFAPFAVRYLGADDIPINVAFATRTLVGAVARAFQPGCKNDTMWILEGAQGAGKSTAIKVLADGLAPDLFTDEMSDPGSKDAGLQMQGKWIIEVSELASFRKSDIDTLKGWLSRSTDRFRRPYGSFTEEFPRSCIMVGTVNPPPSGYMKDPTGNRRFWPTRCGEIDLALLREDASQIWAEALHLYRQGVTWHLTQEESDLAVIAQQARYEHDPWSTLIDDYLAGGAGAIRNKVRVLDLMGTGCINIATERRTPAHSARIEAHLNMIGWVRVERGVYRRS